MRTKNSPKSQPDDRPDQQVLRLADERRDAAERRADGRMHDEAAQERTEAVEVGTRRLRHRAVVRLIVVAVVRALAGRDAVVDAVERRRDRDHDGDHGQRVEKGGQERGGRG